jgi:hypothetical protein
MLLKPEMSLTEFIMVMSFTPTNPAAMPHRRVEIITSGMP